MQDTRILLILPCWNEAQGLPALLKELLECRLPLDAVVVDDGSSDGTAAVAAPFLPVIRLPSNVGIGGAVQTGIKLAARRGYDICIQMDGDGQHPPSEISKLLEAYRKEPSNLVIGSRFLSQGGFRTTFFRRLGIYFIRTALRSSHGSRLSDPTSGFRLLDKKAIKLFSEDYPVDFPEPISIAMALEKGLSVSEVAVTMRSREHGSSSIRGLTNGLYMLRVLFSILFVRIRRYV